MKKLAALVSLILIILSAAASPAAEGNPKADAGHLDLDSCSIDLGTIDPDSVAEATLRFRNTGGAPLQILSIFSDCGCTSSFHTADPVDAGEEGEVRIRFNPKGRIPGPFRKALRIRSNADNPRVVVAVKGIVGDS